LHRLYRVQKQLMMSGSLRRPPSELISCRRHQTRRGRQPRRRALDLGLHLPADDYILVAGADNATPPSPRQEDGLELTLAVGSGGACRRKRRDERAGTGTPLGSDCSGGSLTSTSTDTASGSPPHRRGTPAFHLQEGAAAAMKQPQPQPQPRSSWLVQCLSLKMA